MKLQPTGLPEDPEMERLAFAIGPNVMNRIMQLDPRMQRLSSQVLYALLDQGPTAYRDESKRGAQDGDAVNDEVVTAAIKAVRKRNSPTWHEEASGQTSPAQPTPTPVDPNPPRGDVDITIDES